MANVSPKVQSWYEFNIPDSEQTLDTISSVAKGVGKNIGGIAKTAGLTILAAVIFGPIGALITGLISGGMDAAKIVGDYKENKNTEMEKQYEKAASQANAYNAGGQTVNAAQNYAPIYAAQPSYVAQNNMPNMMGGMAYATAPAYSTAPNITPGYGTEPNMTPGYGNTSDISHPMDQDLIDEASVAERMDYNTLRNGANGQVESNIDTTKFENPQMSYSSGAMSQ